MRTTLDTDDTGLTAARSLAQSQGLSLGRAVSELALRGLRPQTPEQGLVDVVYACFPVYIGEPTVTDELVAAHRDD